MTNFTFTTKLTHASLRDATAQFKAVRLGESGYRKSCWCTRRSRFLYGKNGRRCRARELSHAEISVPDTVKLRQRKWVSSGPERIPNQDHMLLVGLPSETTLSNRLARTPALPRQTDDQPWLHLLLMYFTPLFILMLSFFLSDTQSYRRRRRRKRQTIRLSPCFDLLPRNAYLE